jgi:hypothetical protein
VRAWLDSLPLEHYAKAEAMADLLARLAAALDAELDIAFRPHAA